MNAQTPSECRLKISMAIPTYHRDQVLIDTVRDLLALDPPPAEILVLDQMPEPSIPRAMNR